MFNIKSILLSSVVTLCASGAAFAQSPGIAVTDQAPKVTQNFDGMWNAETSEPTLAMPEGWRVERNLTAPRTLGSFADASTELMYSGGVSLPSNAKNGTWNFGSSFDPSDRAVGGLTTTVSNGTRSVNVMTCVTNAGNLPVEKLLISYDIEKYRKGANAAGFAVQLYTSPDGSTWTSAGDNFYTLFSPDSETLGAEIVPISVTPVEEASVIVDLAAGESLYLAWNISVASGSSPDKAPGLALDNVSITAVFADPSIEKHNIYVEDVTGWSQIALYATNNSLGEYPGMAPVGTRAINGVSYKVFEFTSAPFSAVINNTAGTDLPAFDITLSQDYYLCASPSGVTVIDDPESYTGWVDPSIPPFTPSGIYLRGEVNSWGSPAEWEFSDEGNGVYMLYNKNLSGNFKIADASWSSACNYGSNGSAILPDVDYDLVSGTDSNISCGPNAYTCTWIKLTITADGAKLFLKSNDDPTGLTTVYVIGDNNGWNYMDASGALTLDTADGLFKGKISMPRSASDNLSHWRIYQRLGMGGSWGAKNGVDMTESALSGQLEKGSTANAAVAPGTYSFTFNLATGDYTLTKESAAIAELKLQPENVVLTPELPAEVKILSLNNSLIHYNDQAAVFNEIAEGMGKNAVWTKHTLLGKTLNTHWEEGEGLAADGTPSAKMLVRSEAWSHIILQEQSSLPRTNVEQFRSSLKKWIEYIRENCPNPNAVIIIPMNWAFSSDWDNFTAFNEQFAHNYLDVAVDAGAVICPVGVAYENIFETEGSTGASTLFSDDRHPTEKATYLAACMEYSLIFNEDPSTITVVPASVSADDAAAMRAYASTAMSSFHNPIDHHKGTVDFSATLLDEYGIEVESAEPVTITVDGGGSLEANTFTSDKTRGEFTVTATNGQFTRTAKITVADHNTVVITFPAIELDEENLSATEDFNSIGTDAEATLPEGWRIDRQTVGPRTVGTYPVAMDKTMYAGGVNLPSNAKNGLWNFGSNDDSDRALGGITTGVDNGTRCVNLYTHLHNGSKKNIEKLQVSYDVEKYRMGNNAAGFAVQLYYSIDGRNWTSAGDDFRTYFAPDAQTAGYDEVPGETVTVSATLPAVIEKGCDFYLAWNISVASGDNCAGAQALAIDNFSISGSLPEIPTALHYIYAEDLTGWNSIGLYAWGDSELFGSWPGQAPVNEIEKDGTTYKVFLLDTDHGNYNLIFNNWNNGSQAPDFNITAERDFYLRVSPDKVVDIEASGVENVGLKSQVSVWGNQITAPGASSISVYNSNGMLVAAASGNALDIASLNHGVYIVKVAGESPCTLKVVR